MKGEYITQKSFPFFNIRRQEETFELVQDNMDFLILFPVLLKIVKNSLKKE